MCIDTFRAEDIVDNESIRAMQRNTTQKYENDKYLVASKCRLGAVASKLD